MTDLARPECAACGVRALRPHLSAAGKLGSDGLIPSTDQFGVALGDIWRCDSCSHMQLHPMPLVEDLAQAYEQAASEDYVVEAVGQRATASRALRRIEHHVPGRGRLLDLGCWVGFLLAEARERGWNTLGVEPSEFAAAYAREELGLSVLQADLLRAEVPLRAFAAITMGDVIEHLPAPGDALVRARELLAPDGVLWLALPDAGSPLARVLGRRWWSVIPTHVQYFTRASLVTLLTRHGYDVLEVATAPKAFTVRYYLQRVAGYSRPLAQALVRAAQAVGVAERLWAPDFRDRMMVIARARQPGTAGLT